MFEDMIENDNFDKLRDLRKVRNSFEPLKNMLSAK